MVTSTWARALEHALATHREEAQRLRETHGDPVAWMARIVRDSFDRASLEEVFCDLTEGGSDGDDDDPDEQSERVPIVIKRRQGMTKALGQMTEAATIREAEDGTQMEDTADLDYRPRTELGWLAVAARREYLAAGGHLLSQDEIEREVAERRGGTQLLGEQ